MANTLMQVEGHTAEMAVSQGHSWTAEPTILLEAIQEGGNNRFAMAQQQQKTKKKNNNTNKKGVKRPCPVEEAEKETTNPPVTSRAVSTNGAARGGSVILRNASTT